MALYLGYALVYWYSKAAKRIRRIPAHVEMSESMEDSPIIPPFPSSGTLTGGKGMVGLKDAVGRQLRSWVGMERASSSLKAGEDAL